jgi:hypothetical protein
MKKLFFPVLLFVFTLFFSGRSPKSSSAVNCSVDITFLNSTSYTVTMVQILNLTTGSLKNIDNPTFPFNYGIGNGDYRVTYTFDSRNTTKYSGDFWYFDPIVGCQVLHFYNVGSITQFFTPYCGGETTVDLSDNPIETCFR